MFTSTQLVVTHNGETILQGHRTGPLSHWQVIITSIQPLNHPTSPLPAASLSVPAISPPTLLADQVAFYHAALFSPVLSTWCDALDAGHLTTWPSLTSAQVRRHFPGSIPMNLRHMDQYRASTQSTKPSPDSTATSDTKQAPSNH
jgi:hypothetical protein